MGASAKLDQAAIVEAAFEVLNSEGLEGLSLRLVADQLGVQAPALYWHVHNKAELISLMAATFHEAANPADLDGKSWKDKLMQSARARRHAMLKRRDSARVCVVAQPLMSAADAAPKLTAPLIAAGLTARQALSYQAAVIAYTVGWVAYEQSQAMHDFLTQLIDFDESFETGLQAMVNGFADIGAGDS
jgi:TetR/AcrR family transcriptional regulator, tetracycline repressor protein